MYGNKIDHLMKICESGIPVPDFRIVRFEDVIDVKRYEALWEKDPLAAWEDPAKMTEKFRSCIRPEWDKGSDFALTGISGPVAVRSSCNLEDGEKHSFAGQFSTFLNVPAGEIPGRVIQCMESMFRENVLRYLQQCGVPGRNMRMCVLVQDMVQADRAGVLFTANPQGILNESVITVGRGLGEAIVSGRADTTTYYYHRTDNLYYYEGEEDLLTSAEVEELIALAKRLEELFGTCLDVEFAFENGQLYVLQVRRITTIDSGSPLILDNSNIVESYPGLSLPLTISFVEMVYSGVFMGVSRRVLKNERVLKKQEAVFHNMVGHANGRIYYKISNWYTVLKFLPFHRKIIPIWQEMMGVSQKNYDAEDVELPLLVRFMTYINSFWELIGVPRHMRQLEKKFDRVNREFYEAYREDLSPEELIGLYQEVREQLLDIWDVTLLNDMNTFISTGLVKKRLGRKHPGDEAYVNRYISGISDIESMKPVRALIDLAYHCPEFSPEEYEKRKAEYIREFGDRNLEELKLESRTFRSHPELLEEKIAQYRANPERLFQLHRELYDGRARQSREDPVTDLLGKICAAGIAGREKSRLNRSRVYGMVRQIFRSLGASYAQDGLLRDQEDIFYLSIEEAFSLAGETDGSGEGAGGSAKAKDLREKVEQRKASYGMFAQLPAYSRLIFEQKEFDKQHGRVNAYRKERTDRILQGVPCSAGEVTAQALVIRSVQDAGDVSDKILVTRMTDPGWVFLLMTAKGVISEKGSLLSHTAIISRELGIPSVVGVENLLDTVRTGDLLHLNGNTGTIEIIGGE